MRLIATFLIFLVPSLILAKPFKEKGRLYFLENKGQVKDQYNLPRNDIDLKTPSSGVNVFIGNGEIHYQFQQQENKIQGANTTVQMYRMDVVLVNANKRAQLIKEGEQPYYEQHYTSGEPTTVRSYTKAIYKDIYPSIDWVLYIKGDQLEYDFVVHKGGNPADIKLAYKGANSISINKDGSLTATTPMGSITENAPYSYQEDGKKITSSFQLNGNILSFKIAPHKGELTIDPKLLWSTYYGGASMELEGEVVSNDSGYVYIAGGTQSANNIITIGSHQSTIGGGIDAALVKFNAAGEMVWATYYGGTGSEYGIAAKCDHSDNVYVSGITASPANISTLGSHQPDLNLQTDAFLVKFNGAGVRIWGTYYGGTANDGAVQVACDDSGNVYLAGFTHSNDSISTPGAYQEDRSLPWTFSNSDAFLVKFDSMGVRMWGTYYGGTLSDEGWHIVTDDDCNVYMSGITSSATVMSSPGAHQELYGGDTDAFVVKFNNAGQRVWGTYYGGSLEEWGGALAIHGAHLYMYSGTKSTTDIATPGSYQPAYGGGTSDAFLVKFDTAGTRIWATYYGGADKEGMLAHIGNSIACDNNENIYIVFGCTHVTNFASTDGPQQSYGGGQMDAQLAKFNNAGNREWATYFGSCGRDEGGTCAVDDAGNIYITSTTASAYMATPGSFQGTNGGTDFYLAKFNNDLFGITGDTSVCAGSAVTYYASHVPGAESYTWTLPNGWTGTSTVDTINVTADTTSGIISVVANKSCSTEPPQELYVTVHPLPTPFISAMSGIISVTPSYVGYQWYEGTNPIAGATDSTYIITSYGSYTVIVTDSNGCIGQSNAIHLSVNTINPNDNNIKLYPNPNTGSFTLSISGLNRNEDVSIEITDITGRRIQTFTEPNNSHSFQKNISLDRSIAAGQYFLKLSSGELNKVLMFTKY